MALKPNEKEHLKTLCVRLAEIAARPEHARRRRLWEKHNTLQGERPMFLADQLPWNELDPACDRANAVIGDDYWKRVEIWMKRAFFSFARKKRTKRKR